MQGNERKMSLVRASCTQRPHADAYQWRSEARQERVDVDATHKRAAVYMPNGT